MWTLPFLGLPAASLVITLKMLESEPQAAELQRRWEGTLLVLIREAPDPGPTIQGSSPQSTVGTHQLLKEEPGMAIEGRARGTFPTSVCGNRCSHVRPRSPGRVNPRWDPQSSEHRCL